MGAPSFSPYRFPLVKPPGLSGAPVGQTALPITNHQSPPIAKRLYQIEQLQTGRVRIVKHQRGCSNCPGVGPERRAAHRG